MCWIAYDLQTLTKVANPTHVGYVKVPNHQWELACLLHQCK
jgi:hypothetical protein